MEAEAREILRNALKDEGKEEYGLGTEIAELFKGIELEEPVKHVKIKLRIPKFD